MVLWNSSPGTESNSCLCVCESMRVKPAEPAAVRHSHSVHQERECAPAEGDRRRRILFPRWMRLGDTEQCLELFEAASHAWDPVDVCILPPWPEMYGVTVTLRWKGPEMWISHMSASSVREGGGFGACPACPRSCGQLMNKQGLEIVSSRFQWIFCIPHCLFFFSFYDFIIVALKEQKRGAWVA